MLLDAMVCRGLAGLLVALSRCTEMLRAGASPSESGLKTQAGEEEGENEFRHASGEEEARRQRREATDIVLG